MVGRFNACQNNKFCTDGKTNVYFSLPNTICDKNSCKTFKDIYNTSQGMCEVRAVHHSMLRSSCVWRGCRSRPGSLNGSGAETHCWAGYVG